MVAETISSIDVNSHSESLRPESFPESKNYTRNNLHQVCDIVEKLNCEEVGKWNLTQTSLLSARALAESSERWNEVDLWLDDEIDQEKKEENTQLHRKKHADRPTVHQFDDAEAQCSPVIAELVKFANFGPLEVDFREESSRVLLRILAVKLTAAFVVSCISTTACNFLSTPLCSAGIFCDCECGSTYKVDKIWRYSRNFAYLGILSGFATLVFILVITFSCPYISFRVYKKMFLACTFTGLMDLGVFILFMGEICDRDDSGCTIGIDGLAMAISCFLWFMIAIIFLVLGMLSTLQKKASCEVEGTCEDEEIDKEWGMWWDKRKQVLLDWSLMQVLQPSTRLTENNSRPTIVTEDSDLQVLNKNVQEEKTVHDHKERIEENSEILGEKQIWGKHDLVTNSFLVKMGFISAKRKRWTEKLPYDNVANQKRPHQQFSFPSISTMSSIFKHPHNCTRSSPIKISPSNSSISPIFPSPNFHFQDDVYISPESSVALYDLNNNSFSGQTIMREIT
mmetsp:Transcript_19234/g.43805  ORF Transcript_19234/g.43805 Transcript_19234/m.43805 type:complete len:510 (-) Transcript_19234:211-1740(-)